MQRSYILTHSSRITCKEVCYEDSYNFQENAGDIYAEAKAINEEREAAAEVVDEDDDDLDLDFEEEDVTEESAEAQNNHIAIIGTVRKIDRGLL